MHFPQRPYVTEAGQKSWVHLPLEGVLTVFQGVDHKGATWAKTVGVTPAGVPRYYCDLTLVQSPNCPKLPQMTKEDVRRDQLEDPLDNMIKKSLSARDPQMLLNNSIEGVKVVHKEWDRMRLEDRVIYRRGPSIPP